MNEFAKKNFNLILFLSTLAGFYLPQPGAYSRPVILGFLCFIIFASSFKVRFSLSFFQSQTRLLLGFYVVRYILLPVVVFLLVQPFSSFYATALFLLVVLPSGVTSPAFTNVFNGNITLALALLILSSGLTPLVLPFLGGMLFREELTVDTLRLFTTLFLTVILPYLLHLPVRRYSPVRDWMQSHDSFISIFGIAVIFALAIAEYRFILLTQTEELIPFFVIALAVFLFLYLFGWYVFFKAGKEEKLALFFSSGANNIALGVVISFLYFSERTGVFLVMAEVIWVVVLIPMRRLVGKLAWR